MQRGLEIQKRDDPYPQIYRSRGVIRSLRGGRDQRSRGLRIRNIMKYEYERTCKSTLHLEA